MAHADDCCVTCEEVAEKSGRAFDMQHQLAASRLSAERASRECRWSRECGGKQLSMGRTSQAAAARLASTMATQRTMPGRPGGCSSHPTSKAITPCIGDRCWSRGKCIGYTPEHRFGGTKAADAHQLLHVAATAGMYMPLAITQRMILLH